MDTNLKLARVRAKMEEIGIDAVIIPSTDPHASEYVHPHWKTRAYISGFNGSAGTLVITKTEAGLWTDFRYYIEAEQSLTGTSIQLYKQGLLDTPSINDFLKNKLPKNSHIGIDGQVFTTSAYEDIKKSLGDNYKIVRDFDPATIWDNRPEKPNSIAYELEKKFSGEDTESKLNKVRQVMKDKGADYYILSSLGDIAWLFNIRGEDVKHTPLVLCYAIITQNDGAIFVDKNKIPKILEEGLKSINIRLLDYTCIGDYLVKLPTGVSVYYNPGVLNSYLSGIIPESVKVKRGGDITTDLKAIKNQVEIKNTRKAMEKDGVALVRFFMELEKQLLEKEITEYSLGELIEEIRLRDKDCLDQSFAPIVGYESNGALCHYSAEEGKSKKISPKGMLLIDSGGQYKLGTTDITRTITLGEETEEQKLHYTLVLKGHIAIALAKFPRGTVGGQLDILARKPLWDRCLDYGHGTGHGVGYFLGVHEGPQGISPRNFECKLKEGMIISNEPGLYIEGKYGIRIENLVLVEFYRRGLDSDFLCFENLTLYPYDRNLIAKELLNKEEIEYINNYHEMVLERLSPYLKNNEIKWLEGLCDKI